MTELQKFDAWLEELAKKNGTTKSNNPCKNKTKDSSGLCHHHRD